MGRTQPSLGLAPPAQRKDARAKAAKITVNKTIPAILASSAKARKGVEGSTLIVDPAANGVKSGAKLPKKGENEDGADEVVANGRVKVRVIVGDTLSVARTLSQAVSHTGQSTKPKKNVAVLNMASPLLPGGGFVNGASAQEESLCFRTTLYPALRDEFYRLPEVGAVWTEDVCVFRDEAGNDLSKNERWWVDVISAGMLRFPDVEGDEGEEPRYASAKDRDLAVRKVKCIMEILRSKGVERCVLGAWGCGAYGNPVGEVARAFQKVILGDRKGNGCGDLKNIVFAIKERRMAIDFAGYLDKNLQVEEMARDQAEQIDEEDERDAEAIRELQEQISQLDVRIEQCKTPSLTASLETIRAGLKDQLAQRPKVTATTDSAEDASSDDEDEDASE
ncbi:hypothetical protein LTR10_013469 [Elasticomyces elasticus]|uniref:Microbial-type PARG catalytic domain-containing protein n=1 Tax=Exophiala sideris TaxID=1016849 RepID=A0ABR0JRN1_9EURO|nr:hypothetical protein LTR10_013469 [Elasticomyces elasticus]KAK5039604.1 hypothetical protein LTS07_000098 [Exophiala sideris]KAK5041156.1 hypothetical protein LTR13_002630 [Exophiala sideris]KAK5067981.1 hypothetical protein LTR69_000098 [Exophiala sideris]KAK5187283.1 hypothetical protein LTR44_000098 [Eurotiomycetes sp. CCFEE 6388]